MASAGAMTHTPKAPMATAAAARSTDGVKPVMPVSRTARATGPRARSRKAQTLRRLKQPSMGRAGRSCIWASRTPNRRYSLKPSLSGSSRASFCPAVSQRFISHRAGRPMPHRMVTCIPLTTSTWDNPAAR